MQHNYYIGFQLPDTIRKEIERIQQELFDSVTMKDPLEPHITILPPAAVERVEPEELARQINITAAPFMPLKIALTHVDTYRDYAIAIQVESEAINQLQQALLSLLPPEAEAIYYPNPKFSPHVTLAHALHGKNFNPEIATAFQAKLKHILPESFEAGHLTLFKWISPRTYKSIQIQ